MRGLRDARPATGNRCARRLVRRRAAALAAWATIGTASGLLPTVQAALPAFEAVRAAHRPSDVTITDRHGVPVQTLRTDRTVRRLGWVPLHEMSPALLQAVVLSEDRRFWEHAGVDWAGVARSAFANVWNTRTQGASTLTMQLAGLLDEDLARPAEGRSLVQKIGQVAMARELEARWRKSEILEAWMNTVTWRGEVVGIDAMAQTLFGKHPSGLDAQEAAIAAALVRAPNAPAERVGERACGVLQAMRQDCTGVRTRAAQALARPGGMPLGEQIAPHFARQVVREGTKEEPGGGRQGEGGAGRPGAAPRSGPGAMTVRSTLDATAQRVAVRALRTQLAELSRRHVEDGAAVVLDNATGEVRAWVGSVGDASAAAQVDGVLARRQPGSTLKPFVYGLALERQLLTAATLLDDSPAALPTAAGVYQPKNYDGGYKGPVSVRAALASSLNIPAVRVGQMLPPDALFERLNTLGLALPHSGGFYGASLALGSADVTLLALTNAYRALALGGRVGPVAFVPRTAAAPGKPVMDPAVAFILADILADPAARAMTFGLDSALATRGYAAVKTGTSKDLRDNWCIGFTERYTVGVWVGNASGAPMHAVSGVSGAAPVWRALVEHLHARAPSRAPARPAGVQAVRVALPGGVEPVREELFLAGTAPTPVTTAATRTVGAPPAAAPLRTSTLASTQPIGIAHPLDGSVFALDPDVPPAAQRITFEGEPGTWMLGGRRIGQGGTLRWAPMPGRHELTLVGADGRTRQTVRFEVRGAQLRPDPQANRPCRNQPPPGCDSGNRARQTQTSAPSAAWAMK